MRILGGMVVVSLLVSQVAVAGVEDPDRNATDEVSWHWYTGIGTTDLGKKRKAGERIVDVSIEGTDPWRFAVAMVANTGTYKRTDGFWYGYSAQQVKDKVEEKKARIINIDAVWADGAPQFAFSTVPNSGASGKGWWWNYDRTHDQVVAEINEHKIRLISLKSYDTPDGKRFVYSGIKNEGDDGRAWWWYPNKTPDQIEKLLADNKARLIAIDRFSPGELSVIMVQDPSRKPYWWWAYANSDDRTTEVYSTHGVRIAALDSYISDGKRRYAFVGIDNANAETARLRGYLDRAYDSAKFGDAVIRGVFVKRVGGPILAQMAAHLRFNPLSTLKLLPYLIAWDKIDRGAKDPVDGKVTTLAGTKVTWTQAVKDDPATESDERDDDSCLSPGADGTKQASAALVDALPTMMWFSHNRTLDAVLSHYDPAEITKRGHQLGLKDTEMFFGCSTPAELTPWAKNHTTLMDIAKLYEDVQLLKSLKKSSSRKGFLDHIIRLDAVPGTAYTSPYTGNTVGPLNNEYLRAIVAREAGVKKAGQVDAFMQGLVMRGKGGSGGPSGDEYGYSDSLFIEAPAWQNGKVTKRYYVATWFIYKLKLPAGCPADDGSDSAACKTLWKAENDVRDELAKEIFASAFRDALSTWPDKP